MVTKDIAKLRVECNNGVSMNTATWKLLLLVETLSKKVDKLERTIGRRSTNVPV